MREKRDRKERNHTQSAAILSHICTFTVFEGFHGDELAEFMARCSRQCLSAETNSVPSLLTQALPGPGLLSAGSWGKGTSPISQFNFPVLRS